MLILIKHHIILINIWPLSKNMFVWKSSSPLSRSERLSSSLRTKNLIFYRQRRREPLRATQSIARWLCKSKKYGFRQPLVRYWSPRPLVLKSFLQIDLVALSSKTALLGPNEAWKGPKNAIFLLRSFLKNNKCRSRRPLSTRSKLIQNVRCFKGKSDTLQKKRFLKFIFEQQKKNCNAIFIFVIQQFYKRAPEGHHLKKTKLIFLKGASKIHPSKSKNTK